jgi:hypothetical protein
VVSSAPIIGQLPAKHLDLVLHLGQVGSTLPPLVVAEKHASDRPTEHEAAHQNIDVDERAAQGQPPRSRDLRAGRHVIEPRSREPNRRR